MKECPCGSGASYAECCEPVITDSAPALTAEALMRSRYTAFVVHAYDHLADSLTEESRKDYDPEGVKSWADTSTWLGLNILATEGGGENDETGTVEFVANFEVDGVPQRHHEVAEFQKADGRWLYSDGKIKGGEPVRKGPKVGRNDPCPCGSGKKYKKCCG